MSDRKLQGELSIKVTLSEAFSLYYTNFLVLFTPMLVASLISGTLLIWGTIYTSSIPPVPMLVIGNQNEFMNWFTTYVPLLIGTNLLIGLISMIIIKIASGVVIKFSSSLLENKKTNLWNAVRFTMSKILALLIAVILASIIILLGVIALVVPGIILYVMFSLMDPVIMIENVGPIEGIYRSKALVRHRWLKTFIILLILGILLGMIYVIVDFFIKPTLGVYSFLINSGVLAIVEPLVPVALTLDYYSMRVKEH